jgi:hypothetical protein
VRETTAILKDTIGKVGGAIEDARGPVKQIGQLAQRLNQGEGSLGKLLQDTHMYDDIKSTASYARGCIERVSKVAAVFDGHLEVLPNSYSDRKKTNVKLYFESRLFPCTNFFGLVGLAYSHQGFARRKELLLDNGCRSFKFGKSDAIRLNLQAGIWYAPVGVRVGLYEGTAAVGVDVCMPRIACFQWLSSFDAYDFKGHNRFNNDTRPHLKWLNRFFIGDNFYLTLGADDFISRRNKSVLVGLGAFFSTCDLWSRRC